MFKYKCRFPGCDYQIETKSSMDNHHIVPRSMKGSSNKKANLILLCPSCHRKIFVPGMKNGSHSIKTQDSIIIKGKLSSTQGEVLHFTRCSDNTSYYYFYSDGDIWEA